MKLFCRFKGMIYPGMACTYDDAARVYKRKGIWMVEYLRSRREMVNTDRPMRLRQSEREMIKYYRRKHFESKP